jgi:uncharacterized secreted repeat protein (TIGR03808 family)
MGVGRRQILLGGLGLGLATTAAGPRVSAAREETDLAAFSTYGVVPAGGELDQTATLQLAADQAAETGLPLFLPAGIYSTSRLTLKSGAQIEGVPGRSILRYRDGGALLTLEGAENVRLAGLVLDGASKPLGDGSALLTAVEAKHLDLFGCRFVGSAENGLRLSKVSGWIKDCEIGDIGKAGLFSEDAAGLEIAHNHVRDCGDNGILVWRSTPGEDSTIVSANRIERIAAKSGGSGENGNAINVFRAGSVLVNGNRIADCAFSAIRANSGSNCQIIGNSCARLGETALWAEFAFEGAVIANNLIDKAASGIAVTNFNEGGRLAVVQGNLIRNLFLRKDAVPNGVGIAVEADSVVTGNVIEGSIAYGIVIGWGQYLRDVSVTDGGIRAMSGHTPTGPDLAKASAEAYGNLAVYTNTAR